MSLYPYDDFEGVSKLSLFCVADRLRRRLDLELAGLQTGHR
jgi:hypothetical protein